MLHFLHIYSKCQLTQSGAQSVSVLLYHNEKCSICRVNHVMRGDVLSVECCLQLEPPSVNGLQLLTLEY